VGTSGKRRLSDPHQPEPQRHHPDQPDGELDGGFRRLQGGVGHRPHIPEDRSDDHRENDQGKPDDVHRTLPSWTTTIRPFVIFRAKLDVRGGARQSIRPSCQIVREFSSMREASLFRGLAEPLW